VPGRRYGLNEPIYSLTTLVRTSAANKKSAAAQDLALVVVLP
jgi:hypothetical protein